jgi:isopentenyl-diphosphate delta-isomerase
MLDLSISLVDSNDNVIGKDDVLSAHRGEGKRHRAISVFLFNKNGELLLQKRSEKKIVGALQWSNTCCGNVRIHETYEMCAYRRLQEEMGITKVELQPLYKFEYRATCNEIFSEWEVDQVFYGMYDGVVLPNPSEVAEVRWAKITRNFPYEEQVEFTPWFFLMLKNSQLRRKYLE